MDPKLSILISLHIITWELADQRKTRYKIPNEKYNRHHQCCQQDQGEKRISEIGDTVKTITYTVTHIRKKNQ